MENIEDLPLEGDYRVHDLAEMVLTLRSDLTLSPRREGGEVGYLLEDKVNSKFYRIGFPEYTFISLLDGKTTLRDAVGIAAHVEPEHAVTEEQAATIAGWLVDNQLASTTDSASTAGLEASRSKAANSPTGWNPLFLRIPLFRPDGLLGRLLPWTAWLFGRPGAVMTILLAVIAAYQVLNHWNRIASSSQIILSVDRWLWMTLAWLGVKVVHELAHGIVCKRYGGSVREGGVVLILTAPVAYLDVTSSWRFRSKWERIHTAFAGMQVELLLASLAAIVWSRVQPGVLSDLSFRVMFLASVTTVLFNANPLMRFDGYYILSDWLEMPNLYGEGRQFPRYLVRRFLFGLPASFDCPGMRGAFIAAYGLASCGWRLLVCCTIVLAAASAFHGLGIILAAVGIGLWVVPPTVAGIKYLIWGSPTEQPRRLRLALTVAGITATTATVLTLFPWLGVYQAPVLVEYAPEASVRTGSAGFVREIRVQIGQTVERDQVLAVLENELLAAGVADLRLRVKQSQSRVRALRFDRKTAESQAEAEDLTALQKRLREKEEQFQELVIRAPVTGTVVAHDLDSLRGTYLERGAEILMIGSEDRKELKLSISQADLDVFKGTGEQALRVRIRGGLAFDADLSQISPRARPNPPSDGMTAPLGGPLPVRAMRDSPLKANAHERFELLTPRFVGTVTLDSPTSLSLLAGQRGFASVRATHRSIADHLYSRLRHWIQERSVNLPQLL